MHKSGTASLGEKVKDPIEEIIRSTSLNWVMGYLESHVANSGIGNMLHKWVSRLQVAHRSRIVHPFFTASFNKAIYRRIDISDSVGFKAEVGHLQGSMESPFSDPEIWHHIFPYFMKGKRRKLYNKSLNSSISVKKKKKQKLP